jgi:hypothetical protein
MYKYTSELRADELGTRPPKFLKAYPELAAEHR